MNSGFGGTTFNEKIDGKRLSTQLQAVKTLMVDGLWRSLKQISREVGAPESSISARLRDLRKPRFGGYVVDRNRVSENGGTYIYRVANDNTPKSVAA
jgi:predicted transcriptional regulator